MHTPSLQTGTHFLLTLETIVFLFHLLSATSKPFSSLSTALSHAARLGFFYKNALYTFTVIINRLLESELVNNTTLLLTQSKRVNNTFWSTQNPTDSKVVLYSLPKSNNKARAKTNKTWSDTGSVTLTRHDPTNIVDLLTRRLCSNTDW